MFSLHHTPDSALSRRKRFGQQYLGPHIGPTVIVTGKSPIVNVKKQKAYGVRWVCVYVTAQDGWRLAVGLNLWRIKPFDRERHEYPKSPHQVAERSTFDDLQAL